LKYKEADIAVETSIPDLLGRVEKVNYLAGRTEARVVAKQPLSVTFHQFYFVDWTALIDGKPVGATLAPEYGLVSVSVPPGEHLVVLDHRQLPEQRAGFEISLVALVSLFGAYCLILPRKPQSA
jgi:hypothetical protein